MALSAVDRVAGRKTREQLENQVENLAQSKLFVFTFSDFSGAAFGTTAEPLM